MPRTPYRANEAKTLINPQCPITPPSRQHNVCTSFISSTECTVFNLLQSFYDDRSGRKVKISINLLLLLLTLYKPRGYQTKHSITI